MKFHTSEFNADSVWVDFTAMEVHVFAYHKPNFGPKNRCISLELDLASGELLAWIGIEDSHSLEDIEALARYAFDRIPRKRSWWDRFNARFFNRQRSTK